jgi:serine protease Do
MVASTAPDTKTSVSVIRNGKEQTMTVTVGTQSSEGVPGKPSPSGSSQPSNLGLSVQTVTPAIAKELGLDVHGGALIVDVADGSPAALAGLQKGDVIVEADRKHVANVSDLEQVLGKTKSNGQVLLRVVRDGGSLFVVINL